MKPAIWLAAHNELGFANTWDVYAFESKQYRDEFVESESGRYQSIRGSYVQCFPISRKEVQIYVDSPQPFTGEFRGLLKFGELEFRTKEILANSVGRVDCIGYEYPSYAITPLSEYRILK